MEELSGVEELIKLRRQLIEQADDLKIEFQMCGHQAINTRIMQLNDIIDMIQKRCEEINPVECDW